MKASLKYPAQEALAVVDGALRLELGIHRFDGKERTKAQFFAVGGARGKQFAIVLGNTNTNTNTATGEHPAKQTRVLLEKCALPDAPGWEICDAPYKGSSVNRAFSKLASPNQTSCIVADETALKALLRWYAG
ncbi:MAG: hypothetical protein H6R01_526 [Burkholderiaceae bacterium]|nr:hypothetical protein [Burkholderiaceae bacterium]